MLLTGTNNLGSTTLFNLSYFRLITSCLSDDGILGSDASCKCLKLTANFGQQAFSVCHQILLINRQSCPYMKIFKQLSLNKYFDNMKHNSKEFLWCLVTCYKLQAKQTSLDRAGQTTNFFLAIFKITKHTGMHNFWPSGGNIPSFGFQRHSASKTAVFRPTFHTISRQPTTNRTDECTVFS